MKGILADNDVRGQVEYLVILMQAEPWREFWQDLGLALLTQGRRMNRSVSQPLIVSR